MTKRPNGKGKGKPNKKKRGKLKMMVIGPPDICRTAGGAIQVTVSGTAPNLSGFTGGPEVWTAWYDTLPDPIPMSPATCSTPSLGVATKIQDAGNGFSWGETSFEFDDPCPAEDFSGALVVYYRYESFGNVQVQVDTTEFVLECDSIDECQV